MTYDEETGMTGATALKPGVLKGDILINLDSEDEGELCVGCAGGLDIIAEFKYRKYPVRPGWKGLKIKVKGLQGGHSGMDISLYRANANKVMARILLPLMEVFGVQVVSFTGGSLRNAIPFEAEVETVVPSSPARTWSPSRSSSATSSMRSRPSSRTAIRAPCFMWKTFPPLRSSSRAA